MGLGPAIAVSWEIKGLQPHAEFELHIRYPGHCFGALTWCRDIAESEAGFVLTPARTLLHLNYFVLCHGESSFSHCAKIGGGSGTTQSVLKADSDGMMRGISIERGLQIGDILGRLVVLKVRKNEMETRVEEVEKKVKKGRPVFGLIGCHCPMEQVA
jgi:hypothetical protein